MKSFGTIILYLFSVYRGLGETTNLLNYATKHHSNHHHSHNYCPLKKGKDKKLLNGYYYGTASFYHSRFNGRKTSFGERFSPEKMTCAHRTLPFGTYLEVTNLSNHRTVYVKVNDRLPPHSCRMVDLTRRAAHRLHMEYRGLAHVKIKIIPRKEGEVEVEKEMLFSPKNSHSSRK